jgi:hypothetical protein
VLRDLQAYRDAAQQGTVVGRMKRKNNEAARDIDQLFFELMDPWLGKKEKVGNA